MGWKVVPLHNVRTDGRCSCGHVRPDSHDPDFVCTCGASKCRLAHKPGSSGKHPRLLDWASEASSNTETIDAWFRQWPEANLGIATGSASGLFVLDVDPKNGGDNTLAELLEQHGPLPETATQATPSGGFHYLFKMPGHGVTNRRVGQGLDIRGDGGQIVAAPSRTTAPYRWVRPPWETPVADAPAWLLGMLSRGASGPPGGAADVSRGYFPPASPAVLEAAREALEKHGPAIEGDNGGKHTVHAGMLLTHDFALTPEEAWPLLAEWNNTCVPPWDLDELRTQALVKGEKYGKNPYGCRRAMDVLQRARKVIADWRDSGAANDDAVIELLKVVRPMVETCGDPAKREIIQNELKAATGLGARALDLPRVVRRADAPPAPTALQSGWDAMGLELGKNGAPVANMDNAVRVLEGRKHPAYFETFSQRIYGERGEWTDADTLALTLELQRDVGLLKMTPQIVTDAVRTYAHGRERDRMREAFAALTWDGVERIASFLSVVYGAADTEYTRAASANFWKSLAARALRPGCKCDTMLVLEGAQGLKKSSSLRVLAGPDLFAEASESPTSKDFFLSLQGKLLVEVGEMDAFSRSEVAAVKRVLSCQEDRFRVPYGRATQSFPRRGVFVGTTNATTWARDDTGGRRFWPIACTRVDLDYIRANREQLFAEAVARVNANESWWVMPQAATEAEQEARRAAHPWEDAIAQWLVRQSPRMDNGKVEPEVRVTVLEVLRDCLSLDASRMDRAAQMQVTSVLKRLEWERVDGWRQGGKQKFWRKTGKEAVGSPNPS